MYVKKQSLNYFILLALEKAVDGYVRFDDYVNNSKLYALGSVRVLKKSHLSRAIQRLREGGLVDTKVNDRKILVKLTDLGSDYIPIVQREWDGKWRIVIYDIPEDKRVIRNVFRRKLKEWNFNKWQQSVWITKLDVTKRLRRLIAQLGIDQWVVIIESNDPAIVTLTGRPHR